MYESNRSLVWDFTIKSLKKGERHLFIGGVVAMIGLLLYINALLIGFVYYFLWKKRRVVGFQLGMNISMTAGGLAGICSGILLIYQFPLHFVVITIISTIIGILIGVLFGGLFDYQTLLSGWVSGLMAGIMSPMIGSAAGQHVGFILFIEGIFFFSFIIITASIKNN
jgi:hypothetical protein